MINIDTLIKILLIQGCTINGQQGWCGNWFQLLSNTNQWLWPEGGRKSVVQFQPPIPPVEMPWNYAMESWKVCINFIEYF